MYKQIQLGAINQTNGLYELPCFASKKNEYLCIDCETPLILRKGEERIYHFAHHKSQEKCNYLYGGESEIHKSAKLLLKTLLEKNKQILITTMCNSCKKTTTYEIPIYTENTSQIGIEHRFVYDHIQRIADVAYLDNGELVCIFEICHTNKTQHDARPEPWFEIDAYSLLTTIQENPEDETIYLTCIRNHKMCDDCIPQIGTIYFNQRGAGCGKTYESIQLLSSPKFDNKHTFIYLTKMHSATNVIHGELKQQLVSGNLGEFEEEPVIDDNISKQYKINLRNTKTNRSYTIIIGTIDSFNYAVVNKNKRIKEKNYFHGVVKTIVEGDMERSVKYGSIRYAQESRPLNTSTLVIIDEAQDLEKEYIEAFGQIIRQTDIDVYVIGDKLQSIWGQHNIHTFADTHSVEGVNHISRSQPVNKVLRFHNEQFQPFVNKIIDFEKWGLSPITGICDIPSCKYSHENEIIPYEVFQIPDLNGANNNDIDKTFEKLIKYMNLEIEKYNYLPHNFMFIFPILSKNSFAQLLEIRLQEFWIDKFRDPLYQTNVLKLHPYWKDKMDDFQFYKFCFLHKSSDGTSINLDESQFATRILSIHSSKGNGCEVVFVLDISESALKIFSKESNNLVYDSLLHVAITRQKKSLYIGIKQNNDDIWKRFKNLVKMDSKIKPNLKCISKHAKYSITYNSLDDSTDSNFQKINETIIIPQKFYRYLPIQLSMKNKTIIDWGHHTIRYTIMKYGLLLNISVIPTDNEVVKYNFTNQFLYLLNNICKLEVKSHSYQNYKQALRFIYEYRMNSGHQSHHIPILLFNSDERTMYRKYTNILLTIILIIQKKIRHSIKDNKIPHFCPLEFIILHYMIETKQHGHFSDISIMDVYSIMHHYNECDISEEHDKQNGCECNKQFGKINEKSNDSIENRDIQNSIIAHYNNIQMVNVLFEKYKRNLFEKYNLRNCDVTYNINHGVYFGKKNESFALRQPFSIIGHSESLVVFFSIKPTFTHLNFNDIICQTIFENFILLNIGGEEETDESSCEQKRKTNNQRFFGKTIISCLFTFDSNEPIFMEMNRLDENSILIEIVKKSIFEHYKENHYLLFKLYQFNFEKFITAENKIEIFSEIDVSLASYSEKMPQYIKYFFRDCKKEYKRTKDKTTFIESLNDEPIFMAKIEEALSEAIDEII